MRKKIKAGVAALPLRSKPRPVEEWDFTNCPMDELDYCVYYEYLREDKNRGQSLAARNGTPKGIFPGDFAYYENKWLDTFFGHFKEFPHTPWLKINGKLRSDGIKTCRLWASPFMEVDPERLGDEGDDYPYFPTDVGTRVIHSVHAFEIDWTAGRSKIKEAFDRWLDENAKSVYHDDKTGEISPRELLKFLGTYRLLEDAGGNCALAKEWSVKYGSKASKWVPSYSDDKAWLRAKRKALEVIQTGSPTTPGGYLIQRMNFSRIRGIEKAKLKLEISQIDRAKAREIGKNGAQAHLDKEIEKLIRGA